MDIPVAGTKHLAPSYRSKHRFLNMLLGLTLMLWCRRFLVYGRCYTNVMLGSVTVARHTVWF